MTTKQKIQKFAEEGREQLNAGERVRALLWALLAFGGVALVAELAFVLRGHRVALPILGIPVVVALAVAVVAYLRFRFSHRKAVGHIDRFFGMKEGLVTADEHIREQRGGAIHALQLEQTGQVVESHDPARLRPAMPRRLVSSSIALLIASIALLFVDDSLAVKQQRAEEEATLALSGELSEELDKAMDEMLEKADEDVKELLKDPELKELMEQFKADTDRKAVMRKLSEIDRRLAKKQGELDTRADESYLQALAENLRQSKETAALGNALAQRDYRKAAGELEKMQLGDDASAEERKTLEQLAARIGETEKSMSSSQSGSRRDARDMSKQIRKMAEEQKKTGQCSSGCKNCTNQSICKNCDSMNNLGARKDAQAAMQQLRKQLRNCQSCMGQGQKPGQGAGDGVDRSSRPSGYESPAIGTPEHLSGQLGQGESQKVIEEASSGSGTASGIGAEAADVDYGRQVEAFVRREDIPEEMKHGVKTYFKKIQTLENQTREGAQ